MKKPSSLGLDCFFLLSLVSPAMLSACPSRCQEGFIVDECKCVPCGHEHYWYLRSGEGRCERCTTSCFDQNKNMIEISSCTKKTNRKCQCKPGFYCPSPIALTCRAPCLPCKNGFSKTSSLNIRCHTYTDCSKLGMVVIKEGSSTEDRVCAKPTKPTSPNPLSTALSTRNRMLQSTRNRMLQSTSHIDPLDIGLGTVYPNELSSTKSDYSTREMISFVTSDAEMTSLPNEGPVPLSEPLSKPTWIFVLLLVVLLLSIFMCLAVKCKAKTFTKKLMWEGLVIGKNPAFGPDTTSPKVDTPLPLNDDMNAARGQTKDQGSLLRGNQQVTMDLNGKGESINNTVGSIFIYSPGMVVLGSKLNDRKEEEGNSELSLEQNDESKCEETPLMSVPQQESSSQEDCINMATQEESCKNLSFPVPVTSK